MAESSIALAYKDLVGNVGSWLGYGRGEINGDLVWDTYQADRVKFLVGSGLRQFYWPPIVPPDRASHDWSFLKPTSTVSLAAAATTIRLPDDFGGFEGEITVVPVGSTVRVAWPIKLMPIGMIHQAVALMPTTTGPPQMAALDALRVTSHDTSQHWNLVVYPTSDQAYTLQFQYYLIPEATNGQRQWAYGGAAHAETLLASCMAASEQNLDDTIGVQSARFMERLAASISIDRKHKPQSMGYNRDNSDNLGRMFPHQQHGWQYGGIRVNGVQY